MSKNDFKDNAQVFRLLNDPATCRSTFSNIMRTYQQCLYWHIRKMVSVHDDANDILQNTFIKAWKNILKYRGDANILTWLYRIATNETIDFLNSSYSKHAGECVDFETNLSTHLNNDPLFEGDELEKLLQKAIATLPDKQRLVFNMRYYDDMKYEEIAKVTGTSEGALKASYHIAVKKIEQFIKEED